MTTPSPILIKNVYYMLSYAFETLRRDEFQSVGAEEFDNIHELLGEIYSLALSHITKRGLDRQYIAFDGELATVRGRIDVTATMKLQIARKPRVHCEFDELSTNHLLNQIIASTARLLVTSGSLKGPTVVALRRSLAYFGGVSSIDLTAVSWSAIRLHRNNQFYALLIHLSRFITEGLIMNKEGQTSLESFIDDHAMSWLYEKFLLKFYEKELSFAKERGVTVSSPEITWKLDSNERTMLPKMQSDIVISSPTHTFIIDAKYYGQANQTNFGKDTVKSANLYQMFTYVKNAALASPEKQVAGLLLYAKSTRGAHPDVWYEMSGNRIGATTLDLNQPFDHIKGRLLRILDQGLLPPKLRADNSQSTNS